MDLPLGKGATVQQLFTTVRKDQFEINVAPWGGQLKVNGLEIASVHKPEASGRTDACVANRLTAEQWWGSADSGRQG